MFLQTLGTTIIKAAVLGFVAFLGVIAGKKLRDKKDAKAEKEA